MRIARPIVVEEDVRQRLEQLARGHSVTPRLAMRSRIVLLAAEGLQNKQIAEELKIAPRMAALWRGRFLKLGVDGLLRDAPRPGHAPSISAALIQTLIAKTTQSTPPNAARWSTRAMAREMGISKASVSRIWRANGVKPHHIYSFTISADPAFAEKLDAIVGLYLNPFEHALALSVNENSEIRTPIRVLQGIPSGNGLDQGMLHDYNRKSTRALFATRNSAYGDIFRSCQKKHLFQKWLTFLRMIDQAVPDDKDIYLICDNHATCGNARVQSWLRSHNRFHVCFTPTSASWLDMIELFFRGLIKDQSSRGAFQYLQRLIRDIESYINLPNQSCKYFIWAGKANDILKTTLVQNE